MGKTIFEFKFYKEYLRALVGPSHKRTGIKGAIAKALRCQSTYLSHVLHGNAHLSLEQGEALSDFLGHTAEEKRFLLFLIQKDRAGTKSLTAHFEELIEEIVARRLTLTERLGARNALSEEDKSVYYSSWQYAAIHIALTIPELRTSEALARYFCVRQKRVAEILEFLCKTGIATRNVDYFVPGTTQIRLGKASHQIIKHHANWRNQAIDSLEREEISDLHYSAVVSLSEQDVLKLKNEILEFIKKTLATIHASSEERLLGFNVDFFDLKRT